MTHAKEWKTNYSLKKQPKLAVGKKGNSKNELDAAGLTLDESNKQIYVADCGIVGFRSYLLRESF